jgi:hypothetical protein
MWCLDRTSSIAVVARIRTTEFEVSSFEIGRLEDGRSDEASSHPDRCRTSATTPVAQSAARRSRRSGTPREEAAVEETAIRRRVRRPPSEPPSATRGTGWFTGSGRQLRRANACSAAVCRHAWFREKPLPFSRRSAGHFWRRSEADSDRWQGQFQGHSRGQSPSRNLRCRLYLGFPSR